MSCSPHFIVDCAEKNIFQRVASLVHAPDLHALFSGNDVKIPRLDVAGNHQFDSSSGKADAFAAQSPDAHRKTLRGTHRLQFHEAAIGAALLFDVTKSGNASVFQDQHLI